MYCHQISHIIKFVNSILKIKLMFCEKPLTLNYKQSKYLFNIASKNKCVLYVDDIETFKNKKIILKNKNFVIRKKWIKELKFLLKDYFITTYI